MAQHTHDGRRDRLRERFLNEGIDHFEPHEVLELILYYTIPRGDTNPQAHNLLAHFGSFSNVLEAPVEEVAKVDGIGEKSAFLIHLLPSLFRYYSRSKWSRKVVLGTSREAAEYAISMYVGYTTEAFGIICVDSNRTVQYSGIISEGTTNKTIVYPRDVVHAAIKHNAQNVILTHNHPNGSRAVSPADRALTDDLLKALHVMDINVIDHLIVAGDTCVSMSELGMLRN